MRIHDVFHVSLLEPHKQSQIPGRVSPPPPPIILDAQPEYEVEQILDSRRRRRRLEYLVKWKGYPISDNSWEPATNVANSPQLLDEFHSDYPAKPRPRVRSWRLHCWNFVVVVCCALILNFWFLIFDFWFLCRVWLAFHVICFSSRSCCCSRSCSSSIARHVPQASRLGDLALEREVL
jgi:hypothetical protein